MRSHRSRPGIAALLALGLASAGLNAAVAAETVPSPPPDPVQPTAQASEGGKDTPAAADKISSHSQSLLTQAQSAGKARVTVMTLTKPGTTAAVVGELKKLGASVGYVQDRVGYVRASIATRDVMKIAQIAEVQHVDLDEMLAMPKPDLGSGGTGSTGGTGAAAAAGSGPWTGPTPATPAANPYLPTAETGAVAFKRDHPTYDGRGVTIGILDSGVDLDNPALQTTTTGERKVTNWITATDPLLEADGTWRPMLTHVTGPTAAYGGADWKLPDRPGADFAMNVFRESAALPDPEVKGDIDRDGKTDGVWGILYDYTTGDIWVDVNGNHDFTDDKMMRPYAEKHDVGHFGTDNPATAVWETMPFVVEFRKGVDLTPAGLDGQTADFVNIGVVTGMHGTHVAGIAAGHWPGWAMAGAAPGAKIVSAKACVFAGGCTAVALMEGMIELVANQHVDVVNLSIGSLPALNDGNNARAVLYNRLIDTYGVQLFVSAGNAGPGVNTVGDPSVATDVVSVAAGASKDTWLANYGAAATATYGVQNYSSRGPREDGGLKPNLMAPGSAISAVPMWLGPQDVPEVSYTLPTGFTMLQGTSMASPEATGATALLLSGARQSDLAVTPPRLRAAMYGSARFIDGIPADAQGNGLLQIDKAWPILKKSPAPDNVYTVSAPVCSTLAKLLATPDKGTGIYNRCPASAGGQKVGAPATYDVTVTRTAGPADAEVHTLSWVGNDGTYAAPPAVALPLGKPVTVQVTATPKTSGSHSAILNIDQPGSAVHGAQLMAEVDVADSLEAAPYTKTLSGSVERVRTQSLFVSVPKGAKALQVNLAGIANGSMVRFVTLNPYGVPVDNPTNSSSSCFTGGIDPKICPPTSRAYLNPMPGVWEIEVEASRKTPTTANPFRLTAAVQGVSVEPATQTIDSATVGVPVPLTWTVKNDFGDVTVSGKGGPLGSSYAARPTIKQGETKTYQVVVPAGMSRLDVAIGNTSDKKADLDLYVRDSSGAEVARSADGDSEESVSIPNPKADTYTVQVDGYTVNDPAGTEFDYRDVFFGGALGTLAVDAKTAALKTGQSVTMTGSITAKTQVAEGRKLFGELQVLNGDGAVIGTGQVVVNTVAAPAATAAPTGTTAPTGTAPPTGTATPTGTAAP